MNKVELVFLDFDNTLIKGDSLWYLALYAVKGGYVSKLLLIKIWFWFVFYKLGLVRNPKKIMSKAVSFICDKSVVEFEKILRDFFNDIILEKIYPEALSIIKEHKKAGRKIFIISNSISPLLKLIVKNIKADYFIGTELEVNNKNIYTGKIKGDLSYGVFKVQKIKKYLAKNNILVKKSWAYSDHVSDIPLFEMVDCTTVVNPKKKLLGLAKKRRWEIKYFSL